MHRLNGMAAFTLAAMVMHAKATELGAGDGKAAATVKDETEGADYWDKRVKALEDRVEAVEKAVNAKDRDGDKKTDKSANGRIAAIEAHLGIHNKPGDEKDPASDPAADAEAAKNAGVDVSGGNGTSN